MKLGYILTKFPKVTETFILREILEYQRRGHEVRIYHLTRFRHREVVHDFARPALGWARTLPYLWGGGVLKAVVAALLTRPRIVIQSVAQIVWAFRGRPSWLAKSLLIMPKSIAFARELESWGADHVHAGFAGHPATCAWIAGQ